MRPSTGRRPRDPGRRGGDHGYITVLFAIASMVLLGISAFVLDAGVWYRTGARTQRAADAAALASVEVLVEAIEDGTPVADARTAATFTAERALRLNDVDASAATITFTQSSGTWTSDVRVTERVQPIMAGLLGRGRTTIRRDAQAVAGGCGAECGPVVLLQAPLGFAVRAGTGGDGWQPIRVGNRFFNQFHHDDGAIYCVDATTGAGCANVYPAMPYSDLTTNFTPVLASVDNRVFFVAQQSSKVGLGCWSAVTHSLCPGFATPFAIANHAANDSNNASVRFAGPLAIGSRLYLLGDDLTLRCIDVSSSPANCAGYPRNSPFAGQVSFPLDGSSVAQGVETSDGVQFDMALGDGGRVYLLVTGVNANGASKKTAIACWETTTASACSGFGVKVAAQALNFLFILRDAQGADAGVCAHAGQNGGGEKGNGHTCYRTNGTQVANIPGMFTFGKNPKSGQQAAESPTRTVFPVRGTDSALCWDWTAVGSGRPWGQPCSGFNGTQWQGRNTEDYAYWTDGGPCGYGLGHAGELWSFSMETGATPCDAVGTSARLLPCGCGDGTDVWSTLQIVDLDLSDVSELLLTITLPDGTVFLSVDLVDLGVTSVDLSEIPEGTAYIEVVIEAVSASGDPLDLFVGQQPGVVLQGERTPSLVG